MVFGAIIPLCVLIIFVLFFPFLLSVFICSMFSSFLGFCDSCNLVVASSEGFSGTIADEIADVLQEIEDSVLEFKDTVQGWETLIGETFKKWDENFDNWGKKVGDWIKLVNGWKDFDDNGNPLW